MIAPSIKSRAGGGCCAGELLHRLVPVGFERVTGRDQQCAAMLRAPGNLSSHLTKLEEAELLTIEKRFVRKKSHTTASLTKVGRKRIEAHWRQLEKLRTQFSPGR